MFFCYGFLYQLFYLQTFVFIHHYFQPDKILIRLSFTKCLRHFRSLPNRVHLIFSLFPSYTRLVYFCFFSCVCSERPVESVCVIISPSSIHRRAINSFWYFPFKNSSVSAAPVEGFTEPGTNFFAESQKMFISCQIRSSVTKLLIKIWKTWGFKSWGFDQLPLLSCPSASAAFYVVCFSKTNSAAWALLPVVSVSCTIKFFFYLILRNILDLYYLLLSTCYSFELFYKQKKNVWFCILLYLN